uniref:Uncharacterized protein n=1 Tax=Arundo donax TaxID=35708 RepID=A0A0A9B726_ARUDO
MMPSKEDSTNLPSMG